MPSRAIPTPMSGCMPSPMRSSARSAPAISASISRPPMRAGRARTPRAFLSHAGQLGARARRQRRPCRRDDHLRAAEDRAAPRRDGAAGGRDSWARSETRQRQGDHDRGAWASPAGAKASPPRRPPPSPCPPDRHGHAGRTADPRAGLLERLPRQGRKDRHGGILHRRPDRGRRSRRLPVRPTSWSAASSPTPTRPRPTCSACRRRCSPPHGAVSAEVAAPWSGAPSPARRPTWRSRSPASPVPAARRRHKPVGLVYLGRAAATEQADDRGAARLHRRPRRGAAGHCRSGVRSP